MCHRDSYIPLSMKSTYYKEVRISTYFVNSPCDQIRKVHLSDGSEI